MRNGTEVVNFAFSGGIHQIGGYLFFCHFFNFFAFGNCFFTANANLAFSVKKTIYMYYAYICMYVIYMYNYMYNI